MLRALELARYGSLHASPNPMVGAVIVAPGGRIIGEGWHRRCGGPHAEVNAVRSVKEGDQALLREATIYVTLEPCSHYGKTPPCSLLLIEKGLRRVVVGMTDPFAKVRGRGIRMLQEAGIEVIENFMEDECREINRRFITAHTLRRPWIQLKWAQSRDGRIAAIDENGVPRPVAISNGISIALMHRERARADAILVGAGTVISDDPSLTVRYWPGESPVAVTFLSDRLPKEAKMLRGDTILLDPSLPLLENLEILYSRHSVTSLMVEGGRKVHESFISQNLYDEIRVETSKTVIGRGIAAPGLPDGLRLDSLDEIDGNMLSVHHPA